MNELRVALLPLDIAWADVEENLLSTAAMLRHVDPKTDLVVLPEMFTTAFLTLPGLLEAYTAEVTGRTFGHLRRWSEHFGFAIAGSLIAREGSRLYNRAFLVEPTGDVTTADKRHLFSMGGESGIYSPGEKRTPIIRYRGFNIALFVCYDLRFPVWSRNVECAYDLAIYPANWPDSRAYPWEHLLIARAIENQAFVIGCNRTGADDYGTYAQGRSYVFDYFGKPIGESQRCDAGELVTATLDLDRLRRFREKFPCWRDADPFTLI